jgi:hypothetical protein
MYCRATLRANMYPSEEQALASLLVAAFENDPELITSSIKISGISELSEADHASWCAETGELAELEAEGKVPQLEAMRKHAREEGKPRVPAGKRAREEDNPKAPARKRARVKRL